MTAQRASPLLEPGSGSTEKGSFPSLVLRSDTLPKFFSLFYQHGPLSSPISFPSGLSVIISQVPQAAMSCKHLPIAVKLYLSLFLGWAAGTSGLSIEILALGFQTPCF